MQLVTCKPALGGQKALAHHCDEGTPSSFISRLLGGLVKGVIFWKRQGRIRRTPRTGGKSVRAPSRNYVEGRSVSCKPYGRDTRHSPASERWLGWLNERWGPQPLATHDTARMGI